MAAPKSAHLWHVKHRKAIAAHVDKAQLDALKGATPVTLLVSLGFQAMTLTLAVASGQGWLPWWAIAPAAFAFGTWAVMCRFVVLHELIHDNVVEVGKPVRTLLMRLCDLPAISVGNYLYYRWGHIDHHRNLGAGGLEATLQSVDRADFDYFYHIDTMRFRRAIDDEEPTDPPFFRKPWLLNMVVISAVRFAINLQYILMLPLMVVRGHPNFPNRPAEFHNDIRLQATLVLIQLGLLAWFAGPLALVYLYLSEVFFYFPFHPYMAFFMSSHPSHHTGETCQPTTSVYAGPLFTAYCLTINYHTEHHDFPEVAWWRLPILRRVAGSHYDEGARTAIWSTIRDAMDDPPVYACGDFYAAVNPKQRRT